VVVIDAVGSIMMVTQGMTELFGYPRAELEGANISTLMPQPFSQRHPSYLQRYITTSDPHILDSVREVVALHKDKYVFPVELCVTKLSGVGSDCVFLGLIRPMAMSTQNVRVWISPAGSVLCCDQQFSSLVGLPSEELVGRPWASLVTETGAAGELLDACQVAPVDDFVEGKLAANFTAVHKWLTAIPVRATVKMGGTEQQRIFVVNMARTDGKDEMLLVCDTHGTISFATYDLSVVLGHAYKKLLKMKLTELLPPPFNSLHNKWMKDWPATYGKNSCRTGTVVHLKSATNVHVPVRIQVSQHEDREGTKHVVRIHKSSDEEFTDSRCVQLTVSLEGTVLHASPPESNVYGWWVAGCCLAVLVCEVAAAV
jgi:PAS domain S-box-containing protein